METAHPLSKTEPQSKTDYWRWLALGIFVLAVFARWLPGPRTIDDSFITFRYARNLLAGEGFVYNPGERVMGTTTPLYTGLMVLAGLLSGGTTAPFPWLALGLNSLADGITCLLLLRLGRRLGLPYAGLGTALTWAIAPYSVTFAIGGLETSLYVLLLVGMALAHAEEKHRLAALLAALALLTRPDALIFIGLVALDRLWQLRPRQGRFIAPLRPAVLEAVVFLVPTLIWVAIATAYFGSPIPHSIAAKSLAYRLRPEEGFVRLLQHYATPFLENMTFGMWWVGLALALHPFLFLIGSMRTLKTNPRLWPFSVYPVFYLIIFAAANPLIFRWYLTPPLPSWMFFILAGVETLVRQAATARRLRQTGQAAMLVALVILAPFGLSLRDWQFRPDHGRSTPAPSMAWYKLELLYDQVAEILGPEISQASPTPTLAAGDVGVLGFFSGARILDTVGLNSPISTRYYPLDASRYVINYAVAPDLIIDELPDYVVILEVYGRKGLLKDPRFWQQYQLRQKLPTDIYGSDGMLILQRIKP